MCYFVLISYYAFLVMLRNSSSLHCTTVIAHCPVKCQFYKNVIHFKVIVTLEVTEGHRVTQWFPIFFSMWPKFFWEVDVVAHHFIPDIIILYIYRTVQFSWRLRPWWPELECSWPNFGSQSRFGNHRSTCLPKANAVHSPRLFEQLLPCY